VDFALVVILAELLDALASLFNQMSWNREDDAEVRGEEEARIAREGLHALLLRESLRELKASRVFREVVKINADHHVHCAFGENEK
jgi:hypothetical protein